MPTLYAIEDQILASKASIDTIIMSLRNKTGIGQEFVNNENKPAEINAITQQFLNLKNSVDTLPLTAENACVANLLQIAFGQGTRFDTWLDEQKRSAAGNLITAESNLRAHCQAISNLAQLAITDPAQALVHAESTQIHALATAILFLQRMSESQNFPQRDKASVTDFTEKLSQIRQRLIALNPESMHDLDSITAFYTAPEYHACQQALVDLEHTYRSTLFALIDKAEQSKKFHWHLGATSETLVHALDGLYAKHAKQVTELIEQTPGTATLMSERKQQHDYFLGQRAMRKLIEQAVPEKMSLLSGDQQAKRAALAVQLIAHFDDDLPLLPETIKNNPFFEAGCFEELLLTARPNVFSRDASNGELLIADNDFRDALATNASHPPQEKCDPLCQLLYCIKLSTAKEEWTAERKIEAYGKLINLIKTGQLKVSGSDDNLTQAREMAEKCLWLAVKTHKTDLPQLKTIYAHIESGAMTKALKAITKLGKDASFELLEDQTIQRLFRDRKSLTPSAIDALTTRLNKVYAQDIQLLGMLNTSELTEHATLSPWSDDEQTSSEDKSVEEFVNEGGSQPVSTRLKAKLREEVSRDDADNDNAPRPGETS